MIYTVGAVSQSGDIQVVDDSGSYVTGLVAATFPPIIFSLAGPNADVAITLSDLALITSPWTSGGVKERGGGVYRLDYPNSLFTTAGEGRIRGEATGKHVLAPWIDVGPVVTLPANAPAGFLVAASFGAGAITPTVAPNLDVAVSTRVASAGNLTYVGAVNVATGAMKIVRGDDYYATDNRSLTLNAPVTTGSIPDLTGATVTAFFLSNFTSPARLDLTMTPVTVINPGGANQQVMIQPTHSQTVLLISGSYTVEYQAVLANGHIWTFIYAQATILGQTG